MNELSEKIANYTMCPICRKEITNDQKSYNAISSLWKGIRRAHESCLLEYFEKIEIIEEPWGCTTIIATIFVVLGIVPFWIWFFLYVVLEVGK
jgi:hypothetical protein